MHINATGAITLRLKAKAIKDQRINDKTSKAFSLSLDVNGLKTVGSERYTCMLYTRPTDRFLTVTCCLQLHKSKQTQNLPSDLRSASNYKPSVTSQHKHNLWATVLSLTCARNTKSTRYKRFATLEVLVWICKRPYIHVPIDNCIRNPNCN